MPVTTRQALHTLWRIDHIRWLSTPIDSECFVSDAGFAADS